MSEWRHTTLKELLKEKGYLRGPFGSSLKRGEMKEKGVPVYEQQHAIYNTREFRYFIDETKEEELKRFKTKPNDLLISCSGTVGEVSIINENDPAGIISQALLVLRPDLSKVSPDFLYYFFKTRNGHNQLLSASHGSVQVNIAKREIVESIPIKVPSIFTQNRITEILSSLDDKIELNNQINQNLEALAQTIFKQWFVDFEFPNENGEPYKSSGEEMVDSELGEIPKGWKVGDIGEIGLNIRKTINPSKTKEDTKYLGLEHIPQKRLWISEWDLAEKVTSNKSEFLENDILFGKLRPYFHKVVLAPFNGICSTDILVIRPSKKKYQILLLLHLFSEEVVNYATTVSGGTRMPRVNWSEISKFKVSIPLDGILEKFTNSIFPFLEKIQDNSIENKSLEALRDILLPKLITGELETNDVNLN